MNAMHSPIAPVIQLIFVAALCITAARAQERPYGLERRVANTSLLIDLTQGPPAERLSQTGLFTDMQQQTVAAGIIPYAVNSPLWSDGTHKTRFLALPGTAQIDFSRDGHWTFPPNSVLVKNFYVEFVKGDPLSRHIIETRLLIKEGQQEQWRGFSYRWNEAGTEAFRLRESEELTLFIVDGDAPEGYREQRYFYPGPQDCTFCHREAAGRVLGLRTGQLNGEFAYGSVTDNQLRSLNHIGLFTRDIGEEYTDFPRWPNPLDESEPLEARARAYLAANCAHCHRPDGVDRADFDVRFGVPTSQSRTVGISPSLGRLDAEPERARIILPGNAAASTLYLRTQNFSSFRMPPLATSVLDHAGTDVLRRWIEGMALPTHVAAETGAPNRFSLGQNYPNPFNASTHIDFSLAAPSHVVLALFDASGQRVRTLVDGPRQAGSHTVSWNGRNAGGISLASGVYFYRLQTDRSTQVRRLILLK